MQATRRGAFHFLEKPLTPESVLVTLRSALELRRARDLNRALEEELGTGVRLIGPSPAMGTLRGMVARVAATDARVLITGESGTGKELVATAIHRMSNRSSAPFVRVNSAAIPRELVESEMFGHEKGAFTGAEDRRRGRFELANGGTLFLDEVGDLDAGAQAKLLRAVETGVIERVGGSRPIEVDVRILAATNRDLRKAVEAGEFREDLFFRLEVVPIHIPPLRDRREDVAPLIEHSVERLRAKHGLASPRFSEEAVDRLTGYDWPGNVRELLNLVERLAILYPDHDLSASEIDAVLPKSASGSEMVGFAGDASLSDRLAAHEQALIERALALSDGNVTEASRLLRTDRANLHRRMRRLGL